MVATKILRTVIYLVSIISAPVFLLAQDKNPVIDFASDTQAPMFVETLLLKSNQNQRATSMIFKDVIETRPSALFILGDVVSLSYLDNKWKKMDGYLKTCADKNIPVFAALGNHELMMNSRKGEKNFQTRFPMHNNAGYVEVTDSVAVILLNSNFSKMPDSVIKKQDNWCNATLKKLDNDAAVKLIIVGCHHSPFTNSKIVSPSVEVQKRFVPGFIKSRKGILFLSGHSHNFERFNVQGKNFLVIDGGGGLHQPLNSTKESSRDLAPDYKPMFHYLQVQRSANSLKITSRQLKGDFSGFTDGLVLLANLNTGGN